MSNPSAAPEPAISDAESVVMEVIWHRHPITTEAIVEALADRQDWQSATIKTLINRLLRKGAISAERDGRRYLYSPEIPRQQWLAYESGRLIDRLFAGRVAPLVAHFSQDRKLSRKDIDELKQLIEALDDEY
jgi:predicted transcriptional regulator